MTKCTRVKYSLIKESMVDDKLTYVEIGRFCNLQDMCAIVGCEQTHLWRVMEGKLNPARKTKTQGYKVIRL